MKLLGYGLSAPFERGPGELRSVETHVANVSKDGFLVGTADRTACRGDSGGPMIIWEGATVRVAGVIHGPSGAFCASPVIVVAVGGDLAWIESVTVSDSASYLPFGIGGVAAVLVLGRVFVGRRKRARE